MRATLSFEADVTRVNDIMRSLVLEESNALQEALMALEKATADRIVEGISDALGHIYGVANQLEQYRNMVVSFERARFETMIPQDAPSGEDVNATIHRLAQAAGEARFDNFLERINEESEDENDEPQKG